MPDPARLRAEFPVLEAIAYLNAGTCGPVPRAARRALEEAWVLGERDGRRGLYFERQLGLQLRQREAYAALLGCAPADVALTTSTTDGVMRVVAGLDLRSGDEVLTAEHEHPGLLGPLLAARMRRGVEIRTAPLEQLGGHVGPRTRLVACSHVSWITGETAPRLELPDGVPLLLDGAQGVGAIPLSVTDLGCAFYAGSGQKWLCGPVGTGMLYAAPAWRDRMVPPGFGYLAFADPARALDADALHDDARRLDTPALPAELSAAALAALDVLADAGWRQVHARARELAAALADGLAADGWRVAPRGATTLVSWEVDDPPTARERLAGEGVAVRDLPGTPFVRASVGAWNDEADLDRLRAALRRLR